MQVIKKLRKNLVRISKNSYTILFRMLKMEEIFPVNDELATNLKVFLGQMKYIAVHITR
jgi:hypothetical protein